MDYALDLLAGRIGCKEIHKAGGGQQDPGTDEDELNASWARVETYEIQRLHRFGAEVHPRNAVEAESTALPMPRRACATAYSLVRLPKHEQYRRRKIDIQSA